MIMALVYVNAVTGRYILKQLSRITLVGKEEPIVSLSLVQKNKRESGRDLKLLVWNQD